MYTKSIAVMTALTLALLGTNASAAATKEENIGVGAGAVVGAVAGGPIGLVVGAAIGARLGNSYGRRNDELERLQTSLDASQGELADLQNDIVYMDRELERLQRIAQPELVELMQAGIALDLLFRTDEAALTDTTDSRLKQMATTLANMPGIQIQLDGFADERGASDYNLALSEQRVEFVRDALISAGVHPARIHAAAHGEAIADDATADSFALQRRVSVKLYIDSTPSVAASGP